MTRAVRNRDLEAYAGSKVKQEINSLVPESLVTARNFFNIVDKTKERNLPKSAQKPRD